MKVIAIGSNILPGRRLESAQVNHRDIVDLDVQGPVRDGAWTVVANLHL